MVKILICSKIGNSKVKRLVECSLHGMERSVDDLGEIFRVCIIGEFSIKDSDGLQELLRRSDQQYEWEVVAFAFVRMKYDRVVFQRKFGIDGSLRIIVILIE